MRMNMQQQMLHHPKRRSKNIMSHTSSIVVLLTSLVLPLLIPTSCSFENNGDVDLLEFPLNLEYLEAEFFLFGVRGQGLDAFAPQLAEGGPPPVGGKLANLDPLTADIINQFAFQEVGHLRAIKSHVKGFPRPLLNISKELFAQVIDSAFEKPLQPPFDPYANSVNFLLASYLIPYVGLTGYVGANPKLHNATSKKLVAGLLGVESGQDAIIRGLLYERGGDIVTPYAVRVAEFTDRISILRNKLGKEGIKDEGILVPLFQGTEGQVIGNILSADNYSLSYSRTPEEILRIVYGGGDEHVPGGFFPKGANGCIARSYLKP